MCNKLQKYWVGIIFHCNTIINNYLGCLQVYPWLKYYIPLWCSTLNLRFQTVTVLTVHSPVLFTIHKSFGWDMRGFLLSSGLSLFILLISSIIILKDFSWLKFKKGHASYFFPLSNFLSTRHNVKSFARTILDSVQ